MLSTFFYEQAEITIVILPIQARSANHQIPYRPGQWRSSALFYCISNCKFSNDDFQTDNLIPTWQLPKCAIGWARRAEARTGQETESCGQNRLGGRELRLEQARMPRVATGTGQGAESCGQNRLGGRELRLEQARWQRAAARTGIGDRGLRLEQARGPRVAARTDLGSCRL